MLNNFDVTQFVLSDADILAFPYYYGYLDSCGRWYIQRQNADGSRRYTMSFITPSGTYSTNWNNRANLTYTYWDAWF